MKPFLFILCLVVLGPPGWAQTNALIQYDARQKQIRKVPFHVDPHPPVQQKTISNQGYLPGQIPLSRSAPELANPEATFTKLAPIHQKDQMIQYPLRTQVKLLLFFGDSQVVGQCSGTLIAEDFVLTSAHCLYQHTHVAGQRWPDSVHIVPAYHNGQGQQSLGQTQSSTYYVFYDFVHQSNYQYDIGLLKLEQPIGKRIGWLGYGYHQQDDFYEQRVFHHFSYPANWGYDGMQLHYNHGTLHDVTDTWLKGGTTSVPGESGSSYFYTDNKHEYTIYSNLVFSEESKSNRFDAFKYAGLEAAVHPPQRSTPVAAVRPITRIQAYPTPARETVHVKFQVLTRTQLTFSLLSMEGRLVKKLGSLWASPGYFAKAFDLTSQSNGLYLLKIQAGQHTSVRKVLIRH